MTLAIVNMHILMKKICQSVTLPVTLLIAGKSRVVSRGLLSTPTIQPLPSTPLFPSVSPFFLSLEHMRFSSETWTAAAEASTPLPTRTHNMATIVTSTRFTDEYQLYEELGK